MGPKHWLFRYKAAAQLKTLIYSRDQGSTEQHIQMETDYGGGGGGGGGSSINNTILYNSGRESGTLSSSTSK